MEQLSRQKVQELLNNKPKGISDRQVIESLQNRGYQLEGLATTTPQTSQPKEPLTTRAGNALGSIFGGNKVGEAIGQQIAKGNLGETVQRVVIGRDISPENEALVQSTVTPKQIVGDVARTATNFLPVGRIAGLAQKGARALGLGRAASTAGNIVAGGATGAAVDVTSNIAEGEAPTIGMGTYIGAGIPVAGPVAQALGRVTARGTGFVASELTGKLTGTSQETVAQAFNSARAGGKDLDTFTNTLRGKVTPEQIVNNMRESVSLVAQNNSAAFRETLNELSDNVVSTQPAKDNFRKTLESTGITVNPDGTLNFANNKLRNVKEAQDKITLAWREVNNMPPETTLGELDTTRQAVKAIKSIAGDQPAANLGNMIIEDATRSVRMAGEQVEGYGKMLDNFGETSEFLTELEKGLSAGDSATVDQAYRRIATTLRTNNEQRAALVQELDNATGGALLSEVAGQQLSEALPRGLVGTYLAPVIAGGTIVGGVSPAILPSLLLASPRAVGEFARALGLGAAKTDALIDAIAETKDILIKAGALAGENAEDITDESEK
jgi:hypothetical protein